MSLNQSILKPTCSQGSCPMLTIQPLGSGSLRISRRGYHFLKPVHFGGRLNPKFYFQPPIGIPFFESFAGSHVNTPYMAVTFVG